MLLIKNGAVVDTVNEKVVKKDILCQDGIITLIEDSINDNIKAGLEEAIKNKEVEVIDASSLIVSPGLVDVHVHFRDPGLTYKEDIYTGAKAAAKGGFTSVVMMANTKPVNDNEEILKYCLDKGKETDINVYAATCITKGMQGKELVDMEKLLKAGSAGFTDDGLPIKDKETVLEAMKLSAKLHTPLSFHEEDPALIDNNGVNRGEASKHFNIGGSPREAEITMIKRDLELAVETNAIVNIQHISTKEGVLLVKEARTKSDNVHAEATPHHFTLTEEATIKHGTLAKMNPPLRTEEDRQAIVEGIREGVIDIIATDHAPHSKEEKDKDITSAPSGIIGLETALSLAITTLVHKEQIPLAGVIRAMSLAPASMYGLKAGKIEVGEKADFCIFDENASVIYDSFESKASNSPFIGEKLNGKIIYTICKGNVIFRGM